MEVDEGVRNISYYSLFCCFFVLKHKEDNVPSKKDKVIYYGV